MYTRPFSNRQIQISVMSEPVVIRRRSQSRGRRGRSSDAFTETPTRCSTEPLSRTDTRIGALEMDGTRLIEPRVFYTIEPINVESRDEFVWNSDRYIAIETSDFGSYSCTIAHRIEGQ